MSAEVATQRADKPPELARLVKSNRRQVVLFALLTLILTIATVWGGRIWLKDSETLVFAVGDANGPRSNASRLRLKIVSNADNAKALAQFDRRQADLAVLRTDAKIPPHARAIAILEHDIVLLISPPGKKIKSLADLKKKKIAVLASSDAGAAFVRQILQISDNSDAASRFQMAPPNSAFEKLFTSGGYGAAVVIAHASSIVKDKRFEQYAKARGFNLNAIDE